MSVVRFGPDGHSREKPLCDFPSAEVELLKQAFDEYNLEVSRASNITKIVELWRKVVQRYSKISDKVNKYKFSIWDSIHTAWQIVYDSQRGNLSHLSEWLNKKSRLSSVEDDKEWKKFGLFYEMYTKDYHNLMNKLSEAEKQW